MSDLRLPFQKLDVYVAAKELVRRVHAANIRDPELRDQANRGAKSTFLNLCEGLPNDSVPMRRKYFTTANASLHETVGAMDIAVTIDAASAVDGEAVQELGHRIKRMIRGLMR